VVIKSTIFWDIASTDVSEEQIASIFRVGRISTGSRDRYLLHAGFLLGLFFDPGDGGDMFRRNVG
jgi:hypothetical protein